MSEKNAKQGQEAREGLSECELGDVRGGVVLASRTLDRSVLNLRLPTTFSLSGSLKNSLIGALIGSQPVG